MTESEMDRLKSLLSNLSTDETRFLAHVSSWSWIKHASRKTDVDARIARWQLKTQSVTKKYFVRKIPANPSFVAYFVSLVGGVNAVAAVLDVSKQAISIWIKDGDFPATQALKLGKFYSCPHHLFAWEVFKKDATCPKKADLHAFFGFKGK